MNQNSALAYLDAVQGILDRIRTTQLPNIEAAADICTQSIAGDGLVHLFGTGHSRMFVEEMFPRHGSFPGFHSMVELSLTFHNQVVGSNGQRQAMFLEKVEGLGKTIMRNFVMGPPDSMIIYSNSGVNEVVVEVALEAKARNLPMEEIDGVVALGAPVKVMLWQEVNAKFIGAVEREKVLVTMLFGIISIVAVFLIFCIFFMIVVEKTRDIGIIKSVGATSAGVAQVFLGYGLAIGLTGAVLGTLAGYLIVKNINWLHEMMGTLMGVKIWDAETYAFDTIPNTLNPNEMIVIFCVAVIASVIGALVPAIRAARLNPVEALRWE